ncbi:stage II sporulation protein P [Thermoanaerobacter kivui]|uniref:Stage II sporulation protein P n=1 Tax=Thermoanaerobacter kivui TaxID=2325 RepID=A0A097AS95_THEKI|nr:stage II sporulation protein P [Thermoanaerobacter kivui]AIS52686.1 stage II sporulation protein P [Thermoanaerobacter kivui]
MKETKRIKIIIFGLIAIFLLGITFNAYAEKKTSQEHGYYTVYEEKSDKMLFRTAIDVYKGDRYLSSDNKLYEITKVDKTEKIAYAKYLRTEKLPEVDIEEISQAMAVAENTGEKRIAIYSTHSDESYLPSDGAASINGHGGIYKVDVALQKALEAKGVKVKIDRTLYLPHDAMAYARSRSGAVKLLKDFKPDLLLDVHRDAVPLEEYIRKIAGKNATGVRIVLGRTNPNLKANQQLAYRIKAMADKTYPNIIKDVFFGKGDFNQDLTPNSLLLEFGTYSHTRERAEVSASLIADILTKALYGSDEQKQVGAVTKTQKPLPGQNRAATTAIWILVGVVVVSAVGFMFLSTGGREMYHKFSKATRKEFASYLGKFKRKKGDRP